MQTNPFDYNLGVILLEGQNHDADVMICCHGYGGDEQIAAILHSFEVLPDHLVGFRFPDYGKYFEDPDEILSNRDDALFANRLHSVNAAGKTYVVIGTSGGHSTYHSPL